jgi:hypothetical protein
VNKILLFYVEEKGFLFDGQIIEGQLMPFSWAAFF